MKSVARVIINSPVKNLDRLFDYNIPAFLADKVAPGVRVEVPFGFGNRKKEAYVMELADETSAQNIKDIIRVLDAAPLVDGFGLELIEFIRNTYFCTYNEAIKLLVPPGTGMKYEEYATLIRRDDADELVKNSMNQEAVLNALCASGGVLSLAALQSQAGHNVRSTLRALEKKGLVQIGHVARQAVREKTVTLVSICCEEDPADLCDELAQRAPKQAEIIDFLAGCDRISVADLCMVLNCSKPSVDALVKKGYLCYETAQVRRNPFSQKDAPQTEKMKPTPEQAAALSKILESVQLHENKTFLIHGVTGSGKTEVFLQTIAEVLAQGKTAIVLVPEISLTPQMTSRFLGRFQNVVAILHSALSLGERLDEWNRILSGEAKVVIGARSAIFAPLSNIGVIIVDEEHESTYQSENAPRYNALDVADFRAKQHNALLILASATPSVASYYKAKTGKFELISMQNRYNDAPLPAAEVVDMRAELAAGNRTVFSQRLREEMAVNLKKKEQTVLFLNRRGFSTFVSCRDCGYVATCPECSISLTYHRYNNTLACHYCGYRIPNYETCPGLRRQAHSLFWHRNTEGGGGFAPGISLCVGYSHGRGHHTEKAEPRKNFDGIF